MALVVLLQQHLPVRRVESVHDGARKRVGSGIQGSQNFTHNDFRACFGQRCPIRTGRLSSGKADVLDWDG
jgi:hypothetical protein